MKGYNTKKIKDIEVDYTGCDPIIAGALQNGEAIECWVGDCPQTVNSKTKRHWICNFNYNSSYPYRVLYPGTYYRYAIPIETERVFKSAEEIVQILLDDGWELGRNCSNELAYLKGNIYFIIDEILMYSEKNVEDFSECISQYVLENFTDTKEI